LKIIQNAIVKKLLVTEAFGASKMMNQAALLHGWPKARDDFY